MSPSFESLFSPYLSLTLSAFENAKLVVAVLHANQQPYQVYEVKLPPNVGLYYAVEWQQSWINCGKVNDYNVSLCIADATSKPVIEKTMTIPVLTMTQVSFMCMENAHFDHC